MTARAAAKPVNSVIEEQMWTSQPLFVGNFSFANFLSIFMISAISPSEEMYKISANKILRENNYEGFRI